MPTKLESKLDEYFHLPNPSLRAYFGHVREGNQEEYRTKWYENRNLQDILNEWLNHLESLKDEWPTLWDFENDLAKKVGPLSIMKPLKERMEDINSYYEDILLSSESIDASAVAAVKHEWNVAPPLRIRGQSRTVELMKKSTNSGSPFFSKRRDVLDQTFPAEVAINDPYVLQLLPANNWYSCAVLGWRGQEGGPTDDDVKQRVVWMFPFAINAVELQLYQVLIEAAQRYEIVPAWVSMDSVDKRITHMFDTKGSKDLVVCTDFTKFDQHFNERCQEAAYQIIEHIFHTSPDISSWLHDVFPIKYSIPLMYDEGKLKFGKHGMGSGSGGTNADETLVHRALQYESAQRCGRRLNPNSQCLGDDGVLTFPGITVEDVTKHYTSHGLEMNLSKQYASTDDCTYLRRWHHKDYRVQGICVGVYSTCRALGRLAEQERYYNPKIWSREMVALRQLSILENVKYHPLKEEFVRWAIKGDKYRFGLDIPGFFDSLEVKVKEATSLMPDFLGYVKSEMSSNQGINDWWIVNYLRTLQ